MGSRGQVRGVGLRLIDGRTDDRRGRAPATRSRRGIPSPLPRAEDREREPERVLQRRRLVVRDADAVVPLVRHRGEARERVVRDRGEYRHRHHAADAGAGAVVVAVGRGGERVRLLVDAMTPRDARRRRRRRRRGDVVAPRVRDRASRRASSSESGRPCYPIRGGKRPRARARDRAAAFPRVATTRGRAERGDARRDARER
eukprot:31416-Pelagococcus_subviridis.AAC.12